MFISKDRIVYLENVPVFNERFYAPLNVNNNVTLFYTVWEYNL